MFFYGEIRTTEPGPNIKLFFMLNSAGHKILPANKQQITDMKYSYFFVFSLAECEIFFMTMQMPTIGVYSKMKEFAPKANSFF